MDILDIIYCIEKKYDFEGNLIEDEYITENHAIMMYAPFLQEGEYNS